MNTFEYIEEKIQNMHEEKIIKTKKIPLQSIIITLAGIALLILGITVLNNEITSIVLVVFGISLVIPGTVLIIITVGKKSFDYVYEPTGKKLKKYTAYLNEQDAYAMMSCFHNNDFKAINRLKKTMHSGHLLECRGTDDGQIFLVQHFQYIPYDYIPSSAVIILRNNEAKAMLNWIKS